MIGFLVGLFVGGLVGVFAMCMFQLSANADENKRNK